MLIYQKNNILRSPFEYGFVQQESFLMQHFSIAKTADNLHARRSIFIIEQKTVCITEIFLPIMKQYDYTK